MDGDRGGGAAAEEAAPPSGVGVNGVGGEAAKGLREGGEGATKRSASVMKGCWREEREGGMGRTGAGRVREGEGGDEAVGFLP